MAGDDPSEVEMELLQRIADLQQEMSVMRDSVERTMSYHEMMSATATLVNAAEDIRRFAPVTVALEPRPGTVDAIADMRRALGLATWMPTYDRPVVDIPSIGFIGEVMPLVHDGGDLLVRVIEEDKS